MNNDPFKITTSPMPGAPKMPNVQNYIPKGLMPAGMGMSPAPHMAATHPQLRGRDRAEQLIAESKARRMAHRQEIDARHATIPKGLMP